MTADPRELARRLLKTEGAPTYNSREIAHRQRGLFAAAAWLLGASWSQLGGLFGVRRESTRAMAQRHLYHESLHKPDKKVTLERLSALHAAWFVLVDKNPAHVLAITVTQLAKELDATAPQGGE